MGPKRQNSHPGLTQHSNRSSLIPAHLMWTSLLLSYSVMGTSVCSLFLWPEHPYPYADSVSATANTFVFSLGQDPLLFSWALPIRTHILFLWWCMYYLCPCSGSKPSPCVLCTRWTHRVIFHHSLFQSPSYDSCPQYSACWWRQVESERCPSVASVALLLFACTTALLPTFYHPLYPSLGLGALWAGLAIFKLLWTL